MWTELIYPWRKCKRVGHKAKVKIGVLPEGIQCLFNDTKQKATCKRCHVHLTIYGWVKEG